MSTQLLTATGVRSGYGTFEVLHGVDLSVGAGEVVALFGANGAGKTTLLLTLAGMLPVTKGQVSWRGSDRRLPPHRLARDGMTFVGERAVFHQLSTEANLRLGLGDPERALELFPALRPLLRRRAGLLSGGEQQMLAIGRALAANPAVLLVDELSLGLAPVVVERLLAAIREAAEGGVGVLLVEQQVERALRVADRGYVLRRGTISFSGSRDVLRANRNIIEQAYLARAGEVIER